MQHRHASEVTWTKDVKPLFEKQCQACHGATAPEHDEFAKDKKGWKDISKEELNSIKAKY